MSLPAIAGPFAGRRREKSRRARAARQRFRRLTRETLESRCLLALTSGEDSPWFNPNSGMDVDGDGYVAPADALSIANLINADADRSLEASTDAGDGSGGGFYDVNNDGFANQSDFDAVASFLNEQGQLDGEGSGFGSGTGSGYGSGAGYGSGYGSGTGSGYGSGTGSGYGSGTGSGAGSGTGSGTGSGSGTVDPVPDLELVYDWPAIEGWELRGSFEDLDSYGIITVTINWGDGSPPENVLDVYPGTQLYVPHTYPPDGQSYTVNVTASGSGGSAQWSDTVNRILLDLDTDSDNDGSITTADDPIEHNPPGKRLTVNSDDDNDNGIADLLETGPITGENDLVAFNLDWDSAFNSYVNDYQGWLVVLEFEYGSNTGNIWTTADKTDKIPLTDQSPFNGRLTRIWTVGVDDTSIPSTLFLEATTAGPITLSLSLYDPAGMPANGDPIVFTANAPPVIADVEDRYRWVEDTNELIVQLSVSDFEDPLEDLVVQATASGSASIANYWLDDETLELHFTFTTGIAGFSTVTIAATDTEGASDDMEFDVVSVAITGMKIEYFDVLSAGWLMVNEGEPTWAGDDLRFTASYSSETLPNNSQVQWVIRPVDPANQPWSVFAGGPAKDPTSGYLDEGYWEIKPRISHGATYSTLTQPKKQLHQSYRVSWQPKTDYLDGKSNYFSLGNSAEMGGGDRFFPESNSPTVAASYEDHNTLKVQVRLGIPMPPGQQLVLRLRTFDPDYVNPNAIYFGEDFVDPNGDAGNDNFVEGGDLGGDVQSTTLFFGPGDQTKEAVFQIFSAQPNNNFKVVAWTRGHQLEAMTIGPDGQQIVLPIPNPNDPGGEPVLLPLSADHSTRLLTVWRSLNIERDSLPAPPTTERFDGAGEGNDDVNPGDLGDLPLALLIQEYARAAILVKIVPSEYDLQDYVREEDFVRNITGREHGDAVRDAFSEPSYWVIQMFAAYEDSDSADLDSIPGVPELDPIFGRSVIPDGPAMVYWETLRDFLFTRGDPQHNDIITKRLALHESLHHFNLLHGTPPGDEGIMSSHNVHFEFGEGGNALNRITASQIWVIQNTVVPS